ncbi:hypothetical protein RSOLAG22IIIB_04542 [Rhizoctonia solani]|uniref:Uncharacterized protein n=1 Tax=Rhizoctonia solani TaxID=456999 RepID=A0A0K6FYN9_9AGAM|nr:hypothetical protein RSOLAG22IIIB_04542 [Rhizoctonia solani]
MDPIRSHWNMVCCGFKVWAVDGELATCNYHILAHENGLGIKLLTALAVWVALSLSLDVIMTAITIIYLIRQQRAIPPMIAMIALVFAVYVFNSGGWGTFIYDISSKLFVLSLLIALAG